MHSVIHPSGHDHTRYEKLYPAMVVFAGILILGGFLLNSPREIFEGLLTIVRHEDALITDYMYIANPGAALVNSGLVTAASLWILYRSGVPANGMTIVVTGLMSGFSLFGKNILNIWPILAGTLLYSFYHQEPFSKYATVGLMSTSLAPIVSYVALDNGFGNVICGIAAGLAIGFLMPPLTVYTFKYQNGMNLYNVGFACGLMAFIFVPLLSSMGAAPITYYHWATGYNSVFTFSLSVFCLGLIAGGFVAARKPFWATWAGYHRLLQTSGRAPSDYIRMFGHCPTMINTGINGLIGMLFILATNGDLNGPTLGGILTIMGFSAFGKHAVNILPLMSGVLLASLLCQWSINDPAVQLAFLFCTTMAPLSGYFGWKTGVLAGFIHASVVLHTSIPVAGLNLYNNGFSGGLIAIVLYPLLIDIAFHRRPMIDEEDYLESIVHDEPVTPPQPHEMTEEEEDF